MNQLGIRSRLGIFVLAALLALPAALLSLPRVALPPPVTAKSRTRAVTRTFRNTAKIDMPISQEQRPSANPYPSEIEVSGLKGRIRDVNLRLIGLDHALPDQVFVQVIGPGGRSMLALGHNGGLTALDDVTLLLDDEAATPLPFDATTALKTGAYRPNNSLSGRVEFNAPAPRVNAEATLSVFDGANPNGTWRLYVQDEYGPLEAGAFAGGWELEITVEVRKRKGR